MFAHDLLGPFHADTLTDPPTRGSLIYVPAAGLWDELDYPGGAGYAFTTDANDTIWDPTPTWTDDHTWDDGVGDSPSINFVGGSNDDTAYIFLDDDAVAGNSDLVVRLCAADADSRLKIQSNAPATVAYIDAAGNADFDGHVAIGDGAGVQTDIALYVLETYNDNAGMRYAARTLIDFAPTANFSSTMFGYDGGVIVSTAQARTAGYMAGIRGFAMVSNAIAASNLVLYGGEFWTDVEDAAAALAAGLNVTTPNVDAGSCTSGYGIHIKQGTVGGGTLTTQIGLVIDAMTSGGTNWAVYSVGGNSYHAGDVGIGTTTMSAQLSVDQNSATGAQPVVFLDQGDVDQQHIVVSVNGADVDFPAILQLDVTGAPTLGWVEATDDLAWNMNFALDDGVGDSPALKFIGGSNDDTCSIFLDDDAVASKSDLIVKLCDAGGESNFVIQDSAGTPVFNVDSDGDVHTVTGIRVGSIANTIPDWVIADGGVFVNEDTNTFMTLGITINQGGNDNEALALKSSDVTTPFTALTEADTYFVAQKVDASAGGANLIGYRSSAGTAGRAMCLLGRLGEVADTTKDNTAIGVVDIIAQITDGGTGATDVGADGNLLTVRNSSTCRFIFDAEGSAHADVEWVAFDEQDDVALLTDFEAAMLAQRDPVKAGFVDFLQYNRGDLERVGVVRFGEPGHAMVNFTRLSMLLVGAIRQMNDRFIALEA